MVKLHRVPVVSLAADRADTALLFHHLRLDVFGSRLARVLSEVGTLFQSAVAEGYEHVSELERTLPRITLWLLCHDDGAVVVNCCLHVAVVLLFCYPRGLGVLFPGDFVHFFRGILCTFSGGFCALLEGHSV